VAPDDRCNRRLVALADEALEELTIRRFPGADRRELPRTPRDVPQQSAGHGATSRRMLSHVASKEGRKAGTILPAFL
jgi:hypothetical protein